MNRERAGEETIKGEEERDTSVVFFHFNVSPIKHYLIELIGGEKWYQSQRERVREIEKDRLKKWRGGKNKEQGKKEKRKRERAV